VTPAEEYRHRLESREAAAKQHAKRHDRIGLLRLATAAAGVAAAWLSLPAAAISPWWLLALSALFIALVVYHTRVRSRWSRTRRAAAFYRRGIARIEDRWSGEGVLGKRFDDPHHVYAADLDLFGEGSLFELMCTARTRMGEGTLAEWLLAPAHASEIRERQAAARDLHERLDLREAWAVVGDDDSTAVHPEPLREWAEAPNRLTRNWIGRVAWSIPVLVAATAAAWWITGIASPFMLSLLIAFAFTRSLQAPLHEILHGIENGSGDLKLLTALIAILEAEEFTAPQLRDRASRLSDGIRASQALTQLATVVQLSEARENPILRVLGVPLAYSVHVALAAERWRSAHGGRVRGWLEAIADLEALVSIAAYSYEHPDDVYPELVDGPASFVGTGLGHPLIRRGRCVRNDVSLADSCRALLVSGSNMSGKSTLLRTVGVNAVLAMAGAPVRARSLRLTPLQVGASIRINDSLQEGASRFYAEITRLRQLQELSGRSPPLLFLLDELLQGTNSNDRRIGSEGLLSSYVNRGAVGLITTHDLSLTELAISHGHAFRNFHFQEEFEQGRMTFDYKLREGPVTKSNGLELMRSIGLDV
jgi:hypothetical protein